MLWRGMQFGDCLFFCINEDIWPTVSHHNSRKLLTRQDRKQLNMSVTSTAPGDDEINAGYRTGATITEKKTWAIDSSKSS